MQSSSCGVPLPGRCRLICLVVAVTISLAGLAACDSKQAPTEAPEPILSAPPTAAEPTPSSASPPGGPPPPPAEPTAINRKTATFLFTQEPATLNPLYSSMWFELILQQLCSCWAWQFDDQNAAYPHLVTEIPSTENGGISEDGLVITMNLRDDIVWSDGTPLTAEDFVFTYEMVMSDQNAVAMQYPYDYLESVEATDEQTVVLTFTEPFALWQSLLWQGILPKHILQPVFDEAGSIDEAEWNLAPAVSCGPFVFAEWESGSFLRFTKSHNYWLGVSRLDEIVIRFVPDDASQIATLIAGEADIGAFPPLSDIPALEGAGLEIRVQPSGYNEGWFFNFREMARPGARDLQVRQAIAMALDRDSINRELLLGLTKAPETYWDALPGYVAPDIAPWKYDPEAARDLLEGAGWIDRDGDGIREDADGNKLTLIHGTTILGIRQDSQAMAQQQLKEVGIDLQLMSQDADIFFGSYADGAPPSVGEVDVMQWSDGPYFPDPDIDYWLCSEMPSDENLYGYNYFGCDERLDELFVQQLTVLDTTERQAIFHEISRIMHDQVYWVGLWKDPDYWIVSSRLSGAKFSGATPFYNIMEWDLK